jgi:hypothetical protein
VEFSFLELTRDPASIPHLNAAASHLSECSLIIGGIRDNMGDLLVCGELWKGNSGLSLQMIWRKLGGEQESARYRYLGSFASSCSCLNTTQQCDQDNHEVSPL